MICVQNHAIENMMIEKPCKSELIIFIVVLSKFDNDND